MYPAASRRGCRLRRPSVPWMIEASATYGSEACRVEETLLCLEWDFCLKSGTEKPHGHWMKFSPLPVLPESGSEAACRCGTASDNEVVPGLCAQLIPTVCTKPPWRAEVRNGSYLKRLLCGLRLRCFCLDIRIVPVTVCIKQHLGPHYVKLRSLATWGCPPSSFIGFICTPDRRVDQYQGRAKCAAWSRLPPFHPMPRPLKR